MALVSSTATYKHSVVGLEDIILVCPRLKQIDIEGRDRAAVGHPSAEESYDAFVSMRGSDPASLISFTHWTRRCIE